MCVYELYEFQRGALELERIFPSRSLGTRENNYSRSHAPRGSVYIFETLLRFICIPIGTMGTRKAWEQEGFGA